MKKEPSPNPWPPATNSYTWDARNQLASIAGVTTASFEYGPFGRREGKTINGTTTNFLYDGMNPVQELSGSMVIANMLTGQDVDQFFTRNDSLGVWDYLTDALGNTLAPADSTGTVQTQYIYDPFGGTSAQGAVSSNSYEYTGRENDDDGLYFYRARYSDSTFDRFVSQDPGGFVDGYNVYAYVADNPSQFTDPFGLDKKGHRTSKGRIPPWIGNKPSYPQNRAPSEEPEVPETTPPPSLRPGPLDPEPLNPWDTQMARILKLIAMWLRGAGIRGPFPVIVAPTNPNIYPGAPVRMPGPT